MFGVHERSHQLYCIHFTAGCVSVTMLSWTPSKCRRPHCPIKAMDSFTPTPHSNDAAFNHTALSFIQDKLEASRAYIEMARVVNVVPSLMLVFLGAWSATGRSMSVFTMAPVCLMALVSCFISMASTIVNDFFDRHVNRLNAPNKPLVVCVSPAVNKDLPM